MAKRRNNTSKMNTTGTTVGYEAQLWQMAERQRSSMEKRWKYGVPPSGNASYAAAQHTDLCNSIVLGRDL
ncbi:MAG: hypothetical protein ACPL7K_02300 [Armatimonadota bacterium]